MPVLNDDPLYSPKEAASYLGVRERWIRQAITDKSIPYIKLNHLIKFRRSDLEAFVNARRVEAVQR